MGILGIFSCFCSSAEPDISLSKLPVDILPGLDYCFGANSRGIGSHIGDEACSAFGTEINSLIQLLRNTHGSLRSKAELV